MKHSQQNLQTNKYNPDSFCRRHSGDQRCQSFNIINFGDDILVEKLSVSEENVSNKLCYDTKGKRLD